MRNVRSPWIRYSCVGLIVLIIATFVFLDPILRSWKKRDLAGANPKEGVATVVILVIPDPNHNEMDVKPQATVRFQGGIYPAKEVFRAEGLKIDAPCLIDYRVGKSGTIYVDSVEPVPATHK